MNKQSQNSDDNDFLTNLKNSLLRTKTYLEKKSTSERADLLSETMKQLENVCASPRYCDYFWSLLQRKNKNLNAILMEFTNIFIKLKEIDGDLTSLEKNIFRSVNFSDLSSLGLDQKEAMDGDCNVSAAWENCERSFLIFQRFAKDDLCMKLEKISNLKKNTSNVTEAKGIKEGVAIKKINTLIFESMKFIVEIDQKLGRREPYKGAIRDRSRKQAYEDIIKSLSAIAGSHPHYEVLSAYTFKANSLVLNINKLARKLNEVPACQYNEVVAIECSPISPKILIKNLDCCEGSTASESIAKNSFGGSTCCSNAEKSEALFTPTNRGEDHKCNKKLFIHGGAFFLEYDEEDLKENNLKKRMSFREPTSLVVQSLIEKSSSLN